MTCGTSFRRWDSSSCSSWYSPSRTTTWRQAGTRSGSSRGVISNTVVHKLKYVDQMNITLTIKMLLWFCLCSINLYISFKSVFLNAYPRYHSSLPSLDCIFLRIPRQVRNDRTFRPPEPKPLSAVPVSVEYYIAEDFILRDNFNPAQGIMDFMPPNGLPQQP